MPEAVIVATSGPPRARKKGSLADVRPTTSWLSHQGLLSKVPDVSPGEIVDVMIGCGFPSKSRA